MGSASARVIYEDGRVAWAMFDEARDEVAPVLWPSRDEAVRAAASALDDVRRFRDSETYGARQIAVHCGMGTIVVDRDRCVPVAVELVLGGVAHWWTGLASVTGRILATNRQANEVRVKERGLFRSRPGCPSRIPVTGPAWDAVDWSDVDTEAPAAAA